MRAAFSIVLAVLAGAAGFALARALPDQRAPAAVRAPAPPSPDPHALAAALRGAVRAEVATACAAPVAPSQPAVAASQPPAEPDLEPDSEQRTAEAAALRLVEAARRGGAWGDAEIAELRPLLGAMTAAQRQEVMGRLVRAVNSQEVALASGSLL